MKILFVGTDDLLDWTRKQILASAGYEVLSVRGESEAEAALNSDIYLAVISSLVGKAEQKKIADLLSSQLPDTLLILLAQDGATIGHGEALPPMSEPDQLLKQVGVALMKQHQHPEITSKYFMYVDRNRRYINVSDGVCELLKWGRDEIIGKKIEWLTFPDTADAPVMFRQYLDEGKMSGKYVLRSKTGEPVAVRFKASVLADGCLCSELFPE